MGKIQDITTKDRELEELKELRDIIKSRGYNDEEAHTVALYVQRAGYTKHAFDVEALKKWLDEEVIEHKGCFHDYGTVLKKVKELEG